MAVAENIMWEYMDGCNGEIRVMAARYGGAGWLAAGCAVIEWDFDEKWEDLVGGDDDHFSSRNFFEQDEDIILIEGAESPRKAFDDCVTKLCDSITEINITRSTPVVRAVGSLRLIE